MSESYFQELYKNIFGVSCGADVITNRIETAKILLSNTSSSMEEIASMCGYNSIVHFSRQFKQMTGFAPNGYRKKH
ncbi:MAG: AraC family transcriptional regulator [Oscillospiraceae bacterium]|nr:AraC family transcriptional regulator [Oscillospiraceae bacterium]